jgi:AraC family transcriptional regulator
VDHRVQRIVLMINENIARESILSEAARVVNLSPSRMYHVFKTCMGISPKQYLRMARIRWAKELLSNSFLSVKEIARMVGAGDESHFVRDFKEDCGLTPTQYRNSHHNATLKSEATDSANR